MHVYSVSTITLHKFYNFLNLIMETGYVFQQERCRSIPECHYVVMIIGLWLFICAFAPLRENFLNLGNKILTY